MESEVTMRRWLQRINQSQEGITGLETAIILIAFVIVASVFAYVVLSAGLFSAQKAKEAIHRGLEESRSTIELKGNVLGKTNNGVLQEVYFTVGVPQGGSSVDFSDTSGNNSVVVISYVDAYQQLPEVNWRLTKLTTNGQDNLLDSNELFQITVDLTAVSANVSDEAKPRAYHTFMLELKPPIGPVLIIERTIPARVTEIINLY